MVNKYLQAHKDEFNLYGNRPFLQVTALEPTNNAVVDKLDFGLSAGHNTVLFDHAATPEGRVHTPAWCALMLLTYQCFSPGGTIGETKWSGVPTGRNSNHAPCVEGSALHTLIRGQNMLESIYMNLLTKKLVEEAGLQWGRPIWEIDPTNPPNEPPLKDTVTTYLGRLVPLSRGVLLDPATPKMTLVNGLTYPKLPEVREVSATVLLRNIGKQEQQSYLGTDPAKHPWRELGSILAITRKNRTGGALSLLNLSSAQDTIIDIWTGGLAADKGKVIDAAEWTFSISQSMLERATLHKYKKGVELAAKAEQALGKSISTYCSDLKRENTLGPKAKSHFWSILDSSYRILLQVASSQDLTLAERWYPVVQEAMEQAYDATCPHETPRQIQAFAHGRKSLRVKKPD